MKYAYIAAASLIALSAAFSEASAQTAPDRSAEQQGPVVTGESGSAQAQDAAGANEGSGDIVVTAQKRAENVQDIPLAVSVVNEEQLQAASIREFADLPRLAPSLNLRGNTNPYNVNISLRGIGTLAFGIGNEPSVAVQIDDVPVAFQPRAFSDFIDIERIEVLRGPQSTLYGKSASAGIISIVTRAPTDELSVRASAIATTDEEYRTSLSVAGPLTQGLSFRVTGYFSDFLGNVRNLALDERVNGRDQQGIRGKLLWEISDTVRATFGASYEETEADPASIYSFVGAGALLRNNPALPISVFSPGVVPGEENDRVQQDYRGGFASRTSEQYGKLEFDLPGEHTLLYIAANSETFLRDFQDNDRTAAAVAFNIQEGSFDSQSFTQELRLVSPGDRSFRYTLGLFYSDNDYIRDFFRGPLVAQSDLFATASQNQYAAFAQVDWEIVPRLTLTGGLRGQHEDVGYTFLDRRANNAFFRGRDEDSVATWRGAVRYEFSDDISTYFNYARGYKGQSYDLGSGFNRARADAGPIRPESSDSFEIGLRTQFLDRRLTANLTLFDVTYRNFQTQTIEQLPSGVQQFRLANVGELRSKGVEFEASARITDYLSLSGTVAYTDAIYQEFPGAQCYSAQTEAEGCIDPPGPPPRRQDLSGFRLSNSPRWKGSVSGEFRQPVGGSNEAFLSAIYAYQSSVLFEPRDRNTFQDGYGILNLTLGLRDSRDDRYTLALFVNNVADTNYAAVRSSSIGSYGPARVSEFLPPRDFKRYGGIRLSFNY